MYGVLSHGLIVNAYFANGVKRSVQLVVADGQLEIHPASKKSQRPLEIPLDSHTQIVCGKSTPGFDTPAAAEVDPERCFSVLSPSHTLDAEAPSKHMVDIWVSGLRHFVYADGSPGALAAQQSRQLDALESLLSRLQALDPEGKFQESSDDLHHNVESVGTEEPTEQENVGEDDPESLIPIDLQLSIMRQMGIPEKEIALHEAKLKKKQAAAGATSGAGNSELENIMRYMSGVGPLSEEWKALALRQNSLLDGIEDLETLSEKCSERMSAKSEDEKTPSLQDDVKSKSSPPLSHPAYGTNEDHQALAAKQEEIMDTVKGLLGRLDRLEGKIAPELNGKDTAKTVLSSERSGLDTSRSSLDSRKSNFLEQKVAKTKVTSSPAKDETPGPWIGIQFNRRFVTVVFEGSPASKCDPPITPGMQLIQYDDVPVAAIKEFLKAAAKFTPGQIIKLHFLVPPALTQKIVTTLQVGALPAKEKPKSKTKPRPGSRRSVKSTD